MTLETVRQAVNKPLPPDQRVPRTSTVHNYTGRNDPPARFLVALKRAFPNDVDLNWLLFGDESGGAYALPEAFRKELPPEIADVLSGEAVLALRGVCARAAQSGDRTDEILSRLGFQVAGLLLLPHGALGFRGHPSGQEFTDYVFAISNALHLAVRMRGSEGARLPFRPPQQEGDKWVDESGDE